MFNILLVAVTSTCCFLALAHAAVTSDRKVFLRVTAALAVLASLLALEAPAAALPVLASVILSRRLAGPAIPATVPELLERQQQGPR